MTFLVPSNKLLSPVCRGGQWGGGRVSFPKEEEKREEKEKNPEVNNPFPLQNHSPPLRNRSATRALPCGGSPNREPWKLSGTSHHALTARTVKVWGPAVCRAIPAFLRGHVGCPGCVCQLGAERGAQGFPLALALPQWPACARARGSLGKVPLTFRSYDAQATSCGKSTQG